MAVYTLDENYEDAISYVLLYRDIHLLLGIFLLS